MKTIYKYTLEPKSDGLLRLPKGAEVLSVEEQHENMVLYALVDPELPVTEEVPYKIIGTGHSVDEDISEFTFVGTVKLQNGTLMFHIFTEKTES